MECQSRNENSVRVVTRNARIVDPGQSGGRHNSCAVRVQPTLVKHGVDNGYRSSTTVGVLVHMQLEVRACNSPQPCGLRKAHMHMLPFQARLACDFQTVQTMFYLMCIKGDHCVVAQTGAPSVYLAILLAG
jgi:hypothetical protein